MTTSKKDQQEVKATQSFAEIVGESETSALYGLVKLYRRGQPGVLVSLPIPYGTPEEMALRVDALLDYFQPDNPALEPGLLFSEIVGAVRRQWTNDKGQLLDVIDLYVDAKITKFKTQAVYLDPASPQRRSAFELVSGLRVNQMPIWEGEQSPTWDAQAHVIQKYMCAPQTPFKLVQKPNPKHDPNTEEGKKKPSRLFVGFLHNGVVLGGYDDTETAQGLPVLEKSAKPEPPKGEDTFAQSRGKATTPAAKQEQAKPARETRSLDCVRIDVADRRDGQKGKILRFYSSFDDPNPSSVIGFTREPLREAVGKANDDFFFANVASKPWEKVLESNGSYYPNFILQVVAERHEGTRTVKVDGKEVEESFFYFLVVNVLLTGQPNAIPDLPF